MIDCIDRPLNGVGFPLQESVHSGSYDSGEGWASGSADFLEEILDVGDPTYADHLAKTMDEIKDTMKEMQDEFRAHREKMYEEARERDRRSDTLFKEHETAYRKSNEEVMVKVRALEARLIDEKTAREVFEAKAQLLRNVMIALWVLVTFLAPYVVPRLFPVSKPNASPASQVKAKAAKSKEK